jgi:hypothetical protein
MIRFALIDLWKVAAFLLAAQFGYVLWRIRRELRFRAAGQPSWLPPADYLNFLSMIVVAVCVFALPAIGIVPDRFAWTAFGLSLILAIGFCLALLGHYQLFAPSIVKCHYYFPRPEKIVVALTGLIAVLYVAAAWISAMP